MALVPLVGLVALIAASATGCDAVRDDAAQGARAGEGSWTVVDSSGVTIASSASPVWEGRSAWSVRAAPSVEIGLVEGPAPYLFDQIAGATLSSDGGFAVADMGSSQIRFFDARGEHLRTVGGAGDGPGEFRQIVGFHRAAGDTLIVDDQLRRVHVFDARGQIAWTSNREDGAPSVRWHPTQWHESPLQFARIRGWLGGGRMLAQQATLLGEYPRFGEAPERGTAFEYRTNLLVLAPDAPGAGALSQRETLASFDGPTFVAAEGGAILPEIFGARVLAVADPEGVVVGLPHQSELRMYEADGSLETVVRHAWPQRAVSEEDIARYVEQARQVHPDGIARSRAFSDTHPAFSRLLLDTEGHVWVRRHQPAHDYPHEHFHPTFEVASDWDVFDRSGRWLASVELPSEVTVMEIGRDQVLALHRDAFGIERIRAYPLQRRD